MGVPVEQAGVLQALPRVDLETAQDLQRCSKHAANNSQPAALQLPSPAEDALPSDAMPSLDDVHRKEHVLLRRPMPPPPGDDNASSNSSGGGESVRSAEGPSSDARISEPGLWDSYEEALLTQASGSASHVGLSTSSGTVIEPAHSPPQQRAGSPNQDSPDESSASTIATLVREVLPSPESEPSGFQNGAVPFLKRANNRGAGSAANRDGILEELLAVGFSNAALNSEIASSVEQRYGRGPELADQDRDRQLSERSAGPRTAPETAIPVPLPRPPRPPERAGPEAWRRLPLPVSPGQGQRGSNQMRMMRWAAEAEVPALPGDLKAVRAKGHPWIRCSTFALVPLDERRICRVYDTAGNTCDAASSCCSRILLHASAQPNETLFIEQQENDTIIGAYTRMYIPEYI